MSDDPKADLIYAILAFDAYNRGYGTGITGLSDDVGSTLGEFSLVAHTDNDANLATNEAFANGFYALAYKNDDQVIISYRGTDVILGSSDTKGGNDPVNGYGIALGLTDVPQATLATQFYEAVAGADFGQPIKITLTGHSLGGGLAGFVGAQQNKNSVLFNYMPFSVASTAAGDGANIGLAHAWYTVGEVLAGARAGNLYSGVGDALASIPILPQNLQDALQDLSGLLATETPQTDAPLIKNPLDSHYVDESLLAVAHNYAHSMAMLTALLWARAENKVDWVNAGQELWTAFFDPAVAKALSEAAARTTEEGSPSTAMQAAIAYSALPVGERERPFGDTGIWAMFDDAGDLASALAGSQGAFFSEQVIGGGPFGSDTDVKQYLADLAVQYAGALALYDIEEPADGFDLRDVRKGILALSDDGNVLSLDLSSVLWKDELNGHQVDPMDADKFRKVWFEKAAGDALNDALSSIGIGSPDELAQRFWKASDGHIIDRFGMVTTPVPGGDFTIAPRNYANDPVLGDDAHVDAFVATTGDDKITGTSGHDILVGNGGTDTIDAGAGNDIVVASGGEGSTVVGGLGCDIVYNNSRGGKVYGDTLNGYYNEPVFDQHGNQTGTRPVKVQDNDANSDLFWFAPNVEIMDPQVHDRLVYNGYGLTGGDRNPAYTFAFGGALSAAALGSLNALGYANALGGAVAFAAEAAGIYFDKLHPNIVYHYTPTGTDDEGNEVGDLKIVDMFDAFDVLFGTDNPSGTPSGMMVVHNFKLKSGIFGVQQIGLAREGTLGMAFKDANPLDLALAVTAPLLRADPLTAPFVIQLQGLLLLDYAFGLGVAIGQAAKIAHWIDGSDPLVIDLDGDGIETTALRDSSVYFDVDGDFFAERTGWLKGDDGFLVVDTNGNGRIDDISEMFGGVGASGFAELAAFDSDGDGKITMADAAWADLKVWQDKDGDGVTDDGELSGLNALGIVSLGLSGTPFNLTTPQGNRLTDYGDVTFAGGAVRQMFDAVFNSNNTDTRYAGEGGRAPWQAGLTLDAKGFGSITDLSVAAANDVAFGQLVASAAAAMTTPDLRVLTAQAGDVLGAWGSTLEQTRELMAVRLSADPGSRSGTGGTELLEWKPWDGKALEAGWTLEQAWSPSSRGPGDPVRDEAPYLTQVVDGRAVILDYGIEQPDGTWVLASDPATSYASKDAILALAHPAGTEWRSEEIGFNPYAHLPVDRIGVRFTDGVAVDYTVQVTDKDGPFYVWARNLDRALQLDWKTGDSREFQLRNYAIDFDTLDEVNSTDDSTYRVEMLTPAQFQFATSLGGVNFQPGMLSATLDDTTGHIAYSVGPGGSANLSDDPAKWVSGIDAMIGLLQPVMEQYIVTSRRLAVRMALQSGLKDFASGIEYDVASDSYRPTTDRELAPMFEAIFAGAPASNGPNVRTGHGSAIRPSFPTRPSDCPATLGRTGRRDDLPLHRQ